MIKENLNAAHKKGEDTYLNVENQSPISKSSDKFCPILDTCQQIAYYFVFKKLCLYLKK